jgi:ABC-2 type transport system ATP-binding protein
MSRMNVVEIERLTKSFPSGVQALDGLSLTVPCGTIFGLLGLNGAGKTTTIRIIAGLERRNGGIVRLFGQDVDGLPVSLRTRIGFVLDEALYFAWMEAREYLEFVGVMQGPDDAAAAERTEELLAFFDLLPQSGDTIGTFSTGMKKKVSLAAALIHAPELLILDEPLDGIDPVAADAIKRALTLMASRGQTVMITSHVLDVVERLCTDVAVVHRGTTLIQSPVAELQRTGGGSLEQLFVQLVGGGQERRPLSWL